LSVTINLYFELKGGRKNIRITAGIRA